MIFKHCANCQKLTGHKRAFGAGTVVGKRNLIILFHGLTPRPYSYDIP